MPGIPQRDLFSSPFPSMISGRGSRTEPGQICSFWEWAGPVLCQGGANAKPLGRTIDSSDRPTIPPQNSSALPPRISRRNNKERGFPTLRFRGVQGWKPALLIPPQTISPTEGLVKTAKGSSPEQRKPSKDDLHRQFVFQADYALNPFVFDDLVLVSRTNGEAPCNGVEVLPPSSSRWSAS